MASIIESLLPLPVIPGARHTEHVGSRVTCNPAPRHTDDDWLVLVKDVGTAAITLANQGWSRGGSDPGNKREIAPHEQFTSFTLHKGSLTHDCINIILTQSEHFFDQFMLATHVCRTLNVLPKHHRIVVFQAILYGNEAQGS